MQQRLMHRHSGMTALPLPRLAHCLVIFGFSNQLLLSLLKTYSLRIRSRFQKDNRRRLSKHAESLNKFLIESDTMGDIISL
ncbi:hypothetical protein O9993_20715 [Vibrio lentus]|nr:hypothetical protein [Vibrio lentus]